MAKTKDVQLTKKSIEEVSVRLIGTAPILVGHPLPWDEGSYWDDQPAEVGKSKVKRPSPTQVALLAAITGNGYALDVPTYDETRGVTGYQEAILRGHWLPDHSPGFPVAGFLGAVTTGAVQYGGKNYGLSAVKLRSLMLSGDEQNTTLARIKVGGVTFAEDIGRNSDMKRSPRRIIRLQYELPWETTLRVRFSPALLNVQGVIQAFAWGGDFGIGQRRPSSPHGGQYGTFRVAMDNES